MKKTISISCQYRSGSKQCGNSTKEPSGLCHQHRKSAPLHDINEGTGKNPLLTAIPRVGPVPSNNLAFTPEAPKTPVEVAERLKADKEAAERANPSLMNRILHPIRSKAGIEAEQNAEASANLARFNNDEVYGYQGLRPSREPATPSMRTDEVSVSE